MAELNLDVGAQEKVIAELTETLESMEDEAPGTDSHTIA